MTLTPPLISTIYWRVLVLNYLKIYSKPLSHALRITNNKAILSRAKLLKECDYAIAFILKLKPRFLMAFTFLFLSLFYWCVLFLFFFPLKSQAHFSTAISSSLCFFLPYWLALQAGAWMVEQNLSMCSFLPSYRQPLFWISSVGLAQEVLPN